MAFLLILTEYIILRAQGFVKRILLLPEVQITAYILQGIHRLAVIIIIIIVMLAVNSVLFSKNVVLVVQKEDNPCLLYTSIIY